MTRLPIVERAILRPKGHLETIFWTLGAVAIATLIRLAIDRGESGAPFVTYFPAVVLASLFLGWRAAAVAAVLSAAIANRLFRPELPITAFDAADFIMAALFAFSCAILINAGQLVRRLLAAEHEARDREALLNGELRHRVRNMLTVTQLLAASTLKHSGPDLFLDAFTRRLTAMAKATDLVTSSAEGKPMLRDLVETTIAPFRIGENFQLGGPECKVPQSTCVPLALAIHELSTNALKYGSLSCEGGRVTITWVQDQPGNLSLNWKEEGGPPVRQPTRRGMGSGLLRPGHGLADVQIAFHPSGLECSIQIRK